MAIRFKSLTFRRKLGYMGIGSLVVFSIGFVLNIPVLMGAGALVCMGLLIYGLITY